MPRSLLVSSMGFLRCDGGEWTNVDDDGDTVREREVTTESALHDIEVLM